MRKKPKYTQGQTIILEDKSVIVLQERWDTKIVRKHYQTNEVSWLAYRFGNPDKTFVIKESEIPNQAED